jgi:hypothetical protein
MLGDVPAVPVLLSPARDGRAVDLAPFATVEAALVTPLGGTYAATAQLVDDTDEGRVVECLVPPVLVQAGLYWLRLTLTTGAGGREVFLVPVVVQALDGWHTLATARAEWEDADQLSDQRLYVLLEVSRIECLAYAPKLPTGQLPPLNYREAQLMHARNRNAAWRVDPVSGGDDGSYNIGAHPLDWVVKQLLRPQQGSRVLL